MKWYITKCPTGAEHNAMKAFKELLAKARLEENFGEYFVPYDKSSENKARSRKSNMANYIFIKMDLTPEIKVLISKVETMNLMLDEDLNPIVSKTEDVEKMLAKINEVKEESESAFFIGENVKVLEAPFEDFSATIEKIDEEKQIASVAVPILGRQISLELPFKSIKRIKD